MTITQYVHLKYTVSGSRVGVEYSDSLGAHQVRPTIGKLRHGRRKVVFTPRLHDDAGIKASLSRLLERSRQDTPLLLVTAPPSWRDIDWEPHTAAIVEEMLPGARFAVVRQTGSRPATGPPIQAHVVLGPGVDLDIGRHDWHVEHTTGLAAAAEAARASALVCRADDLTRALHEVGHLEHFERPAMIYTFGPNAEARARSLQVPDGVALFASSTHEPATDLGSVIASISRSTLFDQLGRQRTYVAADPAALNSLTAFEPEAGSQHALPWTSDLDYLMPGTFESSLEPSGRRVDARMRPVLAGGRPGQPIGAGDALVSATRYRIDIQIGALYERSLFTEPPPPIEQDLEPSDDEPWHLEVDLFAGDYTVEGRTQQPLDLPIAGASGEISFVVVAPMVDEPRRIACQLAVYHRGNLAQQFELAGTAFPAGAVGSGDLAMALVSRRLPMLDEADRLPARTISIGTMTAPGGRQRILLKGAGADDFVLGELLSDRLVERYGAILSDAFWIDAETTRYPEVRPGHLGADFEQTIRDLARLGNDFAQELLRSASPANQSRLFALAESIGEIIQVPRYDRSVALPWAAVYDWPVPVQVGGEPKAAVCVGDRPDCTHERGTPLFCLHGFWGVRHVVEEVLAAVPAGRQTLPRPDTPEGILVSVDEVDRVSERLVDAVRAESGLDVATWSDTKATLLEHMWRDDPRLALAVFVGHYAQDTRPREPVAPRLKLQQEREFLLRHDVTNRFADTGRWPPEPGPVVLLLGCTTGPAEVGGLATLVDDFLTAGAPLVVGTVAPVIDAMAYDLGAELSTALLRSDPVGEAMRSWRQRVLAAGNPMAFAFTPVGDASTSFASVAA